MGRSESLRQQTRYKAHLEHLAREAIEATYGNRNSVIPFPRVFEDTQPPYEPEVRWSGRKLSD